MRAHQTKAQLYARIAELEGEIVRQIALNTPLDAIESAVGLSGDIKRLTIRLDIVEHNVAELRKQKK